jgi:hypothetical protein
MLTYMDRYRDIPTFGRDTIRKFVKNVSGMSKLAARDFEDLLQVYQSFAVLHLSYVDGFTVRDSCF